MATKKRKKILRKSGSPARKKKSAAANGGRPTGRAVNKLLTARNPTEYIEFSLKSSLSSGQKSYVTQLWLEKTGHTIADIQYARNRHPYWKKIKARGSNERNRERFSQHDYSRGKSITWDQKKIDEFIRLEEGSRDWELAKKFKTTIPAVQGLRRKINLARRILENRGKRGNKRSLAKLARVSETALRKTLTRES